MGRTNQKTCGQSIHCSLLFAALLANAAIPAYADQFQRIYRAPAFLGRGDTGVAIADNEEAIFYNPAGIALGQGIYKGITLLSPSFEVSSDTRSLLKEVMGSNDGDIINTLTRHIGDNQHIGFSNFSGILLRRAALGLITSNETDVLVFKDPDQAGLESVDARLYSTTGMTFTLGEAFYSGRLLLGATLAYYRRAQAELELGLIEAQNLENTDDLFGTGTTMPVTIGAMIMLPGKAPKSIGVTVHNIGDAYVSSDASGGKVDNLKQRIDIGYASETSSKVAKARLLIDLVDASGTYTSDLYKRLNIGADVTLGNRLGFSAGLNQGGPCVGFFTDIWLLRYDMGFYTEEVGEKAGLRSDQRYFMRIKAGF